MPSSSIATILAPPILSICQAVAMEEAWQVKCSSGRPPPPPPLPMPPFYPPASGSGNQMNMNTQQFVYPVMKQVTNQRVGQMWQEPLLPPALNIDFGKSGIAEMSNSFLALLSGNSHHLSSELLPSTNSRTEPANLTVANGDTFGPSTSHRFSATCGPRLPKNHNTDAIINGEPSSFIASRPLFSTSSKATDVQNNFQALDSHSQFLCSPKSVSRHTSEDIIRPVGVQSRKCGSTPLGTSKNAIQYQENQASQKAPADANFYGLIPSSHFFRGHPRVLCMNTTGELFVNDIGLLAVLCSCHGMPMSVAAFCQHSGLSSTNPREAIRMENGMALGEWFKMFVGNLPPGDSRGLDWSKYSSAEFGSKAFSFPCLSKNSIMNSSEAFGDLGRPGDFLKNSLYVHHSNLVGHASTKNTMNSYIDGEKRSSERNGVHLTRIAGLAQKAMPVISENYKLQAVKGTPEVMSLKGVYLTPNKLKSDINSQPFANNTHDGAKSGITSVSFAPSVPKEIFNYGKNCIDQACSSNEAFIVARDGSDLRLGQPSQHKSTSSSFPAAIDLQFQAAFSSPKMLQRQLSDKTDCAREAKRPRLNQPYPLTEVPSSERRPTQNDCRTTNSFRNYESEDLLTYATKDSSISLFLSHLTGGIDLSDSSDKVHESHMTSSFHGDLLSLREGLSVSTRSEMGEPEKASAVDECRHSKDERDVSAVIAGNCGNMVGNNEVREKQCMRTGKQIEGQRVLPSVISGPCLHSFPSGTGKTSLFSNQPFRSLHKRPEANNPSKHEKMALLEDGDHFSHILHGSQNLVPHLTGIPVCQNSENPITPSTTSSCYISETSCLSCKQDIGLSQQAVDGKLRLLALGGHESLMDMQEQVCSSIKMKSQHGRFCCLSAMETHRNSCKDGYLAHKEGTYCSIHGNISNLHSLPSCICNNEVEVLHCKYGSAASHKCCNCPSSARSNSPCSVFSSCHVCGTGHHLCFRPREISNDTSLENVEHEMCIYKGGNRPFSGKSCCAVISKCLGRCCLGGAVNRADAMMKENVDGRVKDFNPIYDRDAAFQKGRIGWLDQCKCLKEKVGLLDNFQTGSSKDASAKIIGYSASRHDNHGEVSEAPGIDMHADISSEESDSTFNTSTPLDEQQMSNLCSGSSAPAVTEVSIEVNKRDVQLSNAETTMAFHYSVCDKGSGTGKCSSSSEVPGARKLKESPDVNFKVGSSKCRPYCMSIHSSDNMVGKFKFRGLSKLKRLRNKTTDGCSDQENNFQGLQFTVVHELLKRKEYLKQDKLNVTAPNSDFLLADSQSPDSMDESKCLLPSSKRDIAFMQSENVTGSTCIASSGSSNIKQKQCDLSSKFISLKKLEKYHNANKINNLSSNTNKHPFEDAKVSDLMEEELNISVHGGKRANLRLSHHSGEKPPRYMSLSCIRDSENHETETSPSRKRPVVCGNSGIISGGELDSQQKPARIVPLSLILKRAKRCMSDWEVEPKKLISDAKEQHCSELFSCQSQDDSESPCIGRKSEVGSGELVFLGSGKAVKCAWADSLKSGSNFENNKADAVMQMEISKARSSRGELFSFDADTLCCVCGSSYKEDINCLLECNQCMIRVHLACYGISKVPKFPWYCRPCKANSKNIACVLCGYEGGAMTRALKSTNIVKSLLQAWKATIPLNRRKLVRRVESMDDKVLKESSVEVEAKHYEHGFLPVGLTSSETNPAVAFKIDKHNQKSNMQEPDGFSNKHDVYNTIIEGVHDPSVLQWVHVVCGLWTPGTRCPNVDTMNAFEVCGASPARRNIICSLCCRPGGSCIKCRITNCSIHFHPWCAHQKGLLQCETEGEDNEKVGFYGKCMFHTRNNYHSGDNQLLNAEAPSPRKGDWTCARTEGFKSRNRGGFSPNYQNAFNNGDGCIVSQVQINAWHHINGQKSCIRGGIRPPFSDVEYDLRKEYIRYKLSKGWKNLVVYKSSIHALGLYTSQFIARGAMVVEYVGEIVGLRVADKRETEYQSGRQLQCKSACYFFRIDKEHIIDATRKGGIARFVNHSCLPNCVAKIISIRNEKKVVFIAERDIYPGEEITYDYHFNWEDEGKKIPCFCNSKNCRRHLN